MMPHTVPNRPTNGATEEMTARLGKPPSERVRSSRAARAMASEMRDLQFADGLARNAAARFLIARGDDACERFGDFPAGARLTDCAAKAHDRNRALDDEHPAPERGEEQDGHHSLADEARPEEQADRRQIHTLIPTPRFTPHALYCASGHAFQPRH